MLSCLPSYSLLPIDSLLRPKAAVKPSCRPLWLLLLLLLAVARPTCAEDAGLSDKPILQIETGMHTAAIRSLSVDAANHYIASASSDKTVRVWDSTTGNLLQILRPPTGADNEGKIYAVALSPDGRKVACGGWTDPDGQTQSVYIFDRLTGRLARRLTGLPGNLLHLAFSPDGLFLAATLYSGGIRLYRTEDYLLAGQDSSYSDQSDSAAFSPNSHQLVASCIDGYFNLYDVQDNGSLHLTARSKILGINQPDGVAFSPDGTKIACGDSSTSHLAVVSARDLALLYVPENSNTHSGELGVICWSSDGQSLYAGGTLHDDKDVFIRHWDGGGQGRVTDQEAAANTIFAVLPRKAGGIFFCAGDPAFGTLNASGRRILFQTSASVDFRNMDDSFRLSSNGLVMQFSYQSGYKDPGKSLATFSLTRRVLVSGSSDASLATPITAAEGVDIRGWLNSSATTLNGLGLGLKPREVSTCLAIAPDHQSFLLGTGFLIHSFDRNGIQKWQVPTPSEAWAVNISGDGKIALAAFNDGTIRWYRMSDGEDLLYFFPDSDRKRWVVWTPSGYYDCSPGGEDLIGWHVNRGRDHAADFFPASHFRDTYYRPDVVARVLTTLDEGEALHLADAAAGHRTQTADIQKTEPPVVAIASPDDGAQAGSDALTVSYILRTPSGEPVTDVRALVDGRPVKTESGLSVVSADGVTRSLSVPVPARDCLVSVLAFNKFGASVPASVHIRQAEAVKATVRVNAAGPEFTVQPKLYLLAVGISRYDDPALHLTYPNKDAKDFVAAMQAQKGRLYRDVTVYGGKELTDGAATKDAIEDGLDWLQKQTTSNDVAMVFLSGHGGNDSNGKYFFLPVNFAPSKVKSTGLPFTDILSTVQDISGKVILFNDSCHSGNMLGGATKGLPPDNTAIINELISAENGAVCFAASTGSEYAREDPAWGNGAFTKALVEGVDGKADYGHTGRVTVNMLSLYISERVRTLTGGTQHPTANKPPTVRDFPVALDSGQ